MHDELAQKNDNLLVMDKEKNEFLGMVAHDLKNPLSSVIMAISIVKRYKHQLPPEDIEEQLDIIEETSRQMQDIIVRLLDANAIESGKIKMTFDTFDASYIVDTVIEAYTDRAQEKNITLHFGQAEEEFPTFADKVLARQIVENLVSNAVKYSFPNTNVYIDICTVHDENAEPSAQSCAQHFTQITVRDEGPGLSDDDKSKLFTKFAKLSARPTGGENSTGLGLSIVKKLAEIMRGRVWCESELGKGTTFFVVLPVAPLAATEAQK